MSKFRVDKRNFVREIIEDANSGRSFVYGDRIKFHS